MTTTSTGASAKAGASGRSKAASNGHLKTIAIRKTRLTLPATVKFRLLQDMIKTQREGAGLDPLVASLERVLGDEMEKVWEIDVKPGKEGLGQALMDLLDEVYEKVFAAYGTTPGE